MLLDDKGIKGLIQAVVMMHKPFVHEKINDVQIFVICNTSLPQNEQYSRYIFNFVVFRKTLSPKDIWG